MITATRANVVEQVTRAIIVMPGEDLLEGDARRLLDLFRPALARDDPDVGLDPSMSSGLGGDRVVTGRIV
jgi:hypothetical protein